MTKKEAEDMLKRHTKGENIRGGIGFRAIY